MLSRRGSHSRRGRQIGGGTRRHRLRRRNPGWQTPGQSFRPQGTPAIANLTGGVEFKVGLLLDLAELSAKILVGAKGTHAGKRATGDIIDNEAKAHQTDGARQVRTLVV